MVWYQLFVLAWVHILGIGHPSCTEGIVCPPDQTPALLGGFRYGPGPASETGFDEIRSVWCRISGKDGGKTPDNLPSVRDCRGLVPGPEIGMMKNSRCTSGTGTEAIAEPRKARRRP
jgi:hypothetical protein